MSTESPDAYWAVARIEPRKENVAAERIGGQGFDVLLPMLKGRSGVQPMFGSYLFANLNGRHAHWRAIERTPSVSRLIKFGDVPARCPIREIESLRARMDASGIVRLPPPPLRRRRTYAKGEAVLVTGGPFAGVQAIHTGMSAAEREFVLMEILGGQRRIAVPSDFLARPR